MARGEMRELIDGLFGVLDFLGSQRIAGAFVLLIGVRATWTFKQRFTSRRRKAYRELLERLRGNTKAFALYTVRDSSFNLALLAYGAFLVYYTTTQGEVLQISQQHPVLALSIALFLLAAAIVGPLCLFFGIVRFLNLFTLADDLYKEHIKEEA